MGKVYKGSFKQKCDEAGINYNRARQIRLRNNLTDEEVIQYVLNHSITKTRVKEEKTLKSKCKEAGVSYDRTRQIRLRNNLTDEEAIQYVLNHKVKTMCKKKKSKKKNSKTKEESLFQKCTRASVDYDSTKYYRRIYNLTDEEAIEYVINKEKEKEIKKLEEVNKVKVKTFKERCEDVGIKIKKAEKIKSKHNLTADQALIVTMLKM